jgi:hypothetical protein
LLLKLWHGSAILKILILHMITRILILPAS